MIYALRKLIAFVFLGGMFWFVYQDLDNLNEPWFMHALGLITITFAFFWLLIPMVVVRVRVRRRVALNRERFKNWQADGGVANIKPKPARGGRGVCVEPGEQMFFHEKGTLYVDVGTPGFDSLDRPVGRPSDVAFPGHRRKCRVCQRTHFYITNKRIAFEGKDIAIGIMLADIAKVTVKPGGIVFEAQRWDGGSQSKGGKGRFAVTFQNPLVAAAVLDHCKSGN